MSSSGTDRILVFIPAYRCAAQITRVIDQFDAQVRRRIDTVMVVDNRSPDDTLEAAIAQARARITGCQFIAWRNDDNYGLGGSHKAAFRYAIEHGYTHLVVLHGDDQADIRDLLPLLDSGAHRDHDCLLGARFMPGSRLVGYSLTRSWGNRVFNLLFSLAVRGRVRDLGSGLNMYRLKAFEQFYYLTFPDDLTFNYMMLLSSYARRHRIRYFPISWREEDQLSNVRMVSQSFRVLGLLASFMIDRTRFLARDVRERVRAAYPGTIVHRHGAE